MEPNQNPTTQDQNVQGQAQPSAESTPQSGGTPPINPSIPPAGPPEIKTPSGTGGKILLFILTGIVVIVLVSAIYFLAIKNSVQPQNPKNAPIPQKTVSPTPASSVQIQTETESIDLGNTEEDIKSIEQDYNQL